MYKGQLVVIGDMDVNGERMTGIFIETNKAELVEKENLLYKNVIVDQDETYLRD